MQIDVKAVSGSRRILYRLAKSSEWWERRIAMIATATFIDRGDLTDTFAIAIRLLSDKHDLIHKAIGWMLREAGEQSRAHMIEFLKRNYSRIPRTALRHAIEHFPESERQKRIGGIEVSLLSLLLLATPIVACLVPAAAMTEAERECS